MERKHVLGVLAVVLILAGVFVYPRARWAVYGMAVDETMLKMDRFANPPDVLAMADKLKEVGVQRYKLDPATLKVELRFVGQNMGAAGVWWFVHATVSQGGRTIEASPRRVERAIGHDYMQALEEGGCKVVLPGGEGG